MMEALASISIFVAFFLNCFIICFGGSIFKRHINIIIDFKRTIDYNTYSQ
jgi:hypothetical protein